SPQEVADFEEWVRRGAPDPRESKVATPAAELTAHQRWAFTPPQEPKLPDVGSAERTITAARSAQRPLPKTPIDRFIPAQLEEKGLQLSPPAGKRTLLRRVTYDLTGLPPTPEEIDAFLADQSSDAFAKVIDRLLASPHYGERWGRHWLDVARYSDTVGMIDAGRNTQGWFPYSYTYRDWGIRAFNEDLPYDQFILQQLAADKLPNNDPRNLAALGFVSLSRGGLGVSQHEKIDDKIDVVSRGLMGLTVSCARCHNHKFDPIPTKDYYSFYTIFSNSREP